MARNRIQFQKGLWEARFGEFYGTEELCRAAVAGWRWPDGLVCPKCGGRLHCTLAHRGLYQCNACHRQTSLTAGTIFDSSEVPLATWFRAMYLITQTTQGISSIELGRKLGVTQTTAWKIKTKLAEVMRIAGDGERLEGRIEMDDVYLGGHRPAGKPGRGSPGKSPFIAAVETTSTCKPKCIRLKRVARFKRKRITAAAKRIAVPGARVVTDGLPCFRGLADAACIHTATRKGFRAARKPAFRALNTILGNIKSAIVGTYRAVRKKHVARYLAEFEWRFTHRFDLAGMIPDLARAAVRANPAPYWYLKVADYGA